MNDMNDEIRCDYLVTAKQKRIWRVEMDLLTKLLSVCEHNQLHCWVLAGTMLGAVRHKGFIPWDDDIDVCLPRDDYEKLIQVASSEFENPYFLQTPLTDPSYFSSTIRLRNSNTTGIIAGDERRRTNNGIYLDIFPLDCWPETLKEQNNLVKKVTFYNRVLNHKRYLKIKDFKTFVCFILNKMYFAVHSYETTLKKFDSICKTYNNTSITTTAYIARGKVKNDGYRYIWDSEETASTVYLDFEDMKIPVPVGYLSCLRKRYGNYMEFPPAEQRGKWHADIITFDPDTPYLEYQKQHGWL